MNSIRRWLHSVWVWWFVPPSTQLSPPPPPSDEPLVPIKPLPPQPPTVSTAEGFGTFYLREAILDQLDAYFDILTRMKRSDPEDYALYSQIGAHIQPKHADDEDRPILTPWWQTNRPGVGAVAFANLKDIQKKQDDNVTRGLWVPKMVFFRKYDVKNSPLDLQRVSYGDIYVVTVYWDNSTKNKSGPTEYGVHITKDGLMSILMMLDRKSPPIRGTTGKMRGKTFTVPQRQWGIPAFFRRWAESHGSTSPQEYLIDLFSSAAYEYEISNYSMIRVNVEKNGLHGVFGVHMTRTPYFFKDRDVVVNDGGHRRRIFHVVRPHTRSSGAFVKMHFRGHSSFTWNGYRVKITVPGLDHRPLFDFNLHALDEAAVKKNRIKDTFVGFQEMGQKLRQMVEKSR